MAASAMRVGDVGPLVRAVRERLVATGDLPSSAASSEVFDGDVERAVRAFQQRRGMLVDGVVGAQTYRSLDGARWLLGDRILMHTPGHLMAGDDVGALQERLLGLGYPCGRVDAVFGANTDSALRDFQRGIGLRPDGLAGPHTLRALSQIARSVTGGAPHALREADRVRSAGTSLRGRVVVLDPGHSTADPGGVAGELRESDITLDLARRVEGRLAAVGVQVVLTRGLTGDPTQLERADLANSLNADLVLSLHCESLRQSPQAHGVATYFYGSPARGGAWSATGEQLASLVQREIVARTDLLDCRTHPRTWDILRHTVMPAVRVEVGHLSHPGDAARLGDPAFRDTVSEAVVVAVQRVYLGETDDSTTGTLNVADVMARAHQF
ncbi:N-acetylmuramoyl-L-alanine amidase [Angustibacter sp. McL0619]|uniref:N-acetylmuramoyl-L-alanine amidase n=1 Tax=Angustibacter sp. McL0619 TaxID=3415676 RepID=UPI003CFAADD9